MYLELDGTENVMEARKLDDIVNVRYTRDKLNLPTDDADKFHGRMVFYLNTSLDGIAKVLTNKHPKIRNLGNAYITYYYDFISIPTCFEAPGIRKTGITKAVAKRDRSTRYTLMGERMENIKTPFAMNLAQKRNMIYDLNPIIDAMRSNKKLAKMTMLRRVNMFFDSIKRAVNQTADKGDYKGHAIFIDLDEYNAKKSIDQYHFLTYLLFLLKKSEKIIEQYKADYDVLFYTRNGYILFNMDTDLIKSNYGKLVRLVSKLKPAIAATDIADNASKEDIAKQVNVKAGFTGNEEDEDEDIDDTYIDISYNMGGSDNNPTLPVQKSKADKPEVLPITPESDVVKKAESKMDADDESDATVDQILADAESDAELKKELANVIIDSNKGKGSTPSSKRDALLRERQKNVMIKNKTLEELTKETAVPKIEVTKVKRSPVVNENIKEVKFANFQKTYNEEMMESDLAKTFEMFNDKTINMNLIKVDVKDTSDTLNLKDTYRLVFEDEFRRRHTITVDIPKFVDDKHLYINGGTKMIETQITALPVIKTDEDTVRINTNYNKLTIVRKGNKVTPNTERFRKLVEGDNGWKVERGNNVDANRGKLTCLEYDWLAERYNRVSKGNIHFVFNVDALMNETGNKYQSTLDKILIGYKKSAKGIEPIFYDKNNPDNTDIISTMVLHAQPEYYDEFKKMSAGKKYIYTTTSIMRKEIPTVVLLCFFEGLSGTIKKFNDPNVKFVDKKSNQDNYMYIQLADGYLQYPMSDMEACILFNGLTSFTTANYTLSDLDNQQTYIDILIEVCGDGYVAGALVNFYDFMIDPKTLTILKLLSLPTDIVSLIIYANNLLADNQYQNDLNLCNYRLRNNEIVSAILYKQLSIAYARYRATARNSNPSKMSVDRGCVIKALQELPTVQDYPYLGPMTELKMSYLASMKGYAGMNNDEAYKMDKRAYDPSMIGVVGVSTDNAKNCGKERHLVLEPKITNALGMIDLTDPKDIDSLDDTQLETALEMLNPGGLMHDDPVRTAMATKQRGHAIPVKEQSPLLVSNGLDATVQYRTTNYYSYVADQDGEVTDFDTRKKLMTITYKDGTKKCIDLYPRMAKNGGAGMYLKSELQTTFKQGDKFQAGAILAFDPFYYKNNDFFGNRLTFGSLTKTAIMSNSATYEDSDFFTKKFSKAMSSKITMCKRVIIGKNSNIEHIVKVGDHVGVGDELIRFETSYDDAEMNKLLAGIRDDLHEAIVSLGKTRITTKYEGTIEDVICYPAVPYEEMSPSLAKTSRDCIQLDASRMAYLNKVDPGNPESPYKAGVMMTRPTGVVKPDAYGKIDGEDVTDAVMFKFFITYLDELSDGDKVVHMTANKATLGDMIPEGFEPYSEFRPYEEISVLQPPSAILQRGTPSIEPTMLYYKALIELKRKQYEILTGHSWNERQRKENAYMDNKRGFVVGESTEADDDIWDDWEIHNYLSHDDNGNIKAIDLYEKGETIADFPDGHGPITIKDRLVIDKNNPNVMITSEGLVALETILPGENLRVTD